MVSKAKISDAIWVILPGHNEEKRLAPVLEDVLKYANNVVFVDDGSRDNTYEVASSVKGVTVLHHITNFGKGAALKTGCDYAVQNGAKYMIVMDSDGQHEAIDILKFAKELLSGNELVFGCRPWNQNMPFVMKMGNFGLYFVIKLLFGFDVMDTQSGYRAFSSEAYQKVRWESNDYAMESEMIIRASKIKKLKYSKLTIRTIYLDDYKGTTIMVGIKILLNLFFWRIFGVTKQRPDSDYLSVDKKKLFGLF